jgi:hypothetical protein
MAAAPLSARAPVCQSRKLAGESGMRPLPPVERVSRS